MRYFEDTNSKVFGYEDSQTDLIAQAISNNWTELQVAPTPPAIVVSKISSKDFFGRFTDTEKATVASATLTNIQIKIIYDTMWGADFVDVTDAETIAGVDALIASSLIDSSRKSTLLATGS